jgi:hypothetical protein
MHYDVFDNFSVNNAVFFQGPAMDKDRQGRLRSCSERAEYVEETRQGPLALLISGTNFSVSSGVGFLGAFWRVRANRAHHARVHQSASQVEKNKRDKHAPVRIT